MARPWGSVYFGCWEDAGHYLWAPGMQRIPTYVAATERLPYRHMDGSDLLLPRPEVPGHGSIAWLGAVEATAVAWWDKTFDSRPGSNACVLVFGYHPVADALATFRRDFPQLAAAGVWPSTIAELDRGGAVMLHQVHR